MVVAARASQEENENGECGQVLEHSEGEPVDSKEGPRATRHEGD